MNEENGVNEGCIGPTSDMAGKASACQGCPNQNQCATGKGASPDKDNAELEIFHRLSGVKNKILGIIYMYNIMYLKFKIYLL